ncbi:MAG: pilus assembly protein [Deltaproteobacteria bacterium]|nr:pilus assembly protein [Deltaproteobacteria bacterium]
MSGGPRGEQGQVVVEAALVFPSLLFLILGILQLTLMQQARLMVEYAAFSAARAGALENMDRRAMQQAAVVALLPTLPTTPVQGAGNRSPLRVDGPGRLLARHAELWKENEASTAFFGKRVIEVEPLNPAEEDFGDREEIDFDFVGDGSPQARRPTQLTVRLTYFYELRIPAVNAVLWESWLAANAGIGLRGLDAWRPRIDGVDLPRDARFALEMNALKHRCRFSAIGQATHLRLALLAKTTGRYFFPIVTTHTLRLQSNPFRRNALKRSELGC